MNQFTYNYTKMTIYLITETRFITFNKGKVMHKIVLVMILYDYIGVVIGCIYIDVVTN